MTKLKSALGPLAEKLASKRLTPREQKDLEQEMSGMSTMLTSPNQVYDFRLTQYGASSASGTSFLSHISCDISGGVEFASYLRYMFTECRLRSARLTLLPSNVAQHAGGNYCCVLVGSDQVHYNYNPSSPQEVADLADSRLVPSVNVDLGAPRTSYQYPLKFTEYKWASTATPVADVAAGLTAQYSLAATDVCYNNQILFYWLLEVDVEFRNRS